MGRVLQACAGLLCLGMAVSAWAQTGDPCANLAPPSVKVERLETRVTTNLDYNVGGLTRLGSKMQPSQRQILGLTKGQAVVRYALVMPRLVTPDGRWECASPQLTLSYGFDPITVYVAREFPAGSCAYQEIYTHEVRHLEAYKAHAVQVEAELTRALQKRFADTGPWRGAAGQAEDRLRQELGERWVPYVRDLLDRVEAEQRRIDTPEEYDRIAASCNGEISQRLGN